MVSEVHDGVWVSVGVVGVGAGVGVGVGVGASTGVGIGNVGLTGGDGGFMFMFALTEVMFFCMSLNTKMLLAIDSPSAERFSTYSRPSKK